jgi:hypothetical protein
MSVETFDKLLRFEIDRDENYISVTCEREENGNLFEDYMTFHADDVIEMSFSPRNHEHKQDYITTIQFSRIGNDCTFETTKANVLKIEEALFKNKSPKFLLLPESESAKENSNAPKAFVGEKCIVKNGDILTPKEIEALWSSPYFNMPSRVEDELQLQEEQIISDAYLLPQAVPQTTDVREAYTKIKNCLKQDNVIIKARWLYTHLPQFKDDKGHQIIDAELHKDINGNPCLYLYVGDTNWFYGNDCCIYAYDKNSKITYLIYKPKHLVLKESQEGEKEKQVQDNQEESDDYQFQPTSDIHEASKRINKFIAKDKTVIAEWHDHVHAVFRDTIITETSYGINIDGTEHLYGYNKNNNRHNLDTVHIYYILPTGEKRLIYKPKLPKSENIEQIDFVHFDVTSNRYEAATRINDLIAKGEIVKAYWFDCITAESVTVRLTEAFIRNGCNQLNHLWGKNEQGEYLFLDNIYIFCERDNKTGENDGLSITMPIYLPCVKPSKKDTEQDENESTSSKVESLTN